MPFTLQSILMTAVLVPNFSLSSGSVMVKGFSTSPPISIVQFS